MLVVEEIQGVKYQEQYYNSLYKYYDFGNILKLLSNIKVICVRMFMWYFL